MRQPLWCRLHSSHKIGLHIVWALPKTTPKECNQLNGKKLPAGLVFGLPDWTVNKSVQQLHCRDRWYHFKSILVQKLSNVSPFQTLSKVWEIKIINQIYNLERWHVWLVHFKENYSRESYLGHNRNQRLKRHHFPLHKTKGNTNIIISSLPRL